ncbi:hypothetical protein GF361_05090 [Candidatus Woesearchaeota archaeon]|nr:hypothetical protein [Candidatus Woesearchaeota archaeon]
MSFIEQRKPAEKMLKAELLEEVKRLENKLTFEQKDNVLEKVDFFEYMKKLYIDHDKDFVYKDIIVTGAVLKDFDIYKKGWLVSNISDKKDYILDLGIENIDNFVFATHYDNGDEKVSRDYYKEHLKSLKGKVSSFIVNSSKRGNFDSLLDVVFGSPWDDEEYYHHLVGYVVKEDEECGLGDNKINVVKGQQYLFKRYGELDLVKKFC